MVKKQTYFNQEKLMTAKILTHTLLATTLAFSSATPWQTTKTTKQQSNSISTNIDYKN